MRRGFKPPFNPITYDGKKLIRINILDLTPGTRTNLTYHRETTGFVVYKSGFEYQRLKSIRRFPGSGEEKF